jgi:hypothetical protein
VISGPTILYKTLLVVYKVRITINLTGEIMSLRAFIMTAVSVLSGLLTVPGLAIATDSGPVLVVHDKQFEPKELDLPPGVRVKLVIRNQDSLPLEFESYDLSREIVLKGHGEGEIYIGPLKPGEYKFFNDFDHEMQGVIVVKPVVKRDN